MLFVRRQDSGCPCRLFCLRFCVLKRKKEKKKTKRENCSIFPVVKGTRVAFLRLRFLLFSDSALGLFTFLSYGIVLPACLLVDMSESEVHRSSPHKDNSNNNNRNTNLGPPPRHLPPTTTSHFCQTVLKCEDELYYYVLLWITFYKFFFFCETSVQ